MSAEKIYNQIKEIWGKAGFRACFFVLFVLFEHQAAKAGTRTGTKMVTASLS